MVGGGLCATISLIKLMLMCHVDSWAILQPLIMELLVLWGKGKKVTRTCMQYCNQFYVALRTHYYILGHRLATKVFIGKLPATRGVQVIIGGV
jgi:hypothetical protein